eukprot:4075977-Pleurochrysis_carterae.AAC.1
MQAVVHASSGSVRGHDADVVVRLGGMYGQTTRARGLVFRLTAAVHTCRNAPLEQAATPHERQNKTIALRRWR